MAFTSYNSAYVVSQQGKASYAYVTRNDQNQICVLDTNTPGPVDFAIYYAHPITGEDKHRALKKKVVRINVYGEGDISTDPGMAYMIVIADQSRVDVYPYSPQSADSSQNMIWCQNLLPLTARVIDVVLLVMGSGIVFKEAGMEYSVVG